MFRLTTISTKAELITFFENLSEATQATIDSFKQEQFTAAQTALSQGNYLNAFTYALFADDFPGNRELMTTLSTYFEREQLQGNISNLLSAPNYKEVLYIHYYFALMYTRQGNSDAAKPHIDFLKTFADKMPSKSVTITIPVHPCIPLAHDLYNDLTPEKSCYELADMQDLLSFIARVQKLPEEFKVGPSIAKTPAEAVPTAGIPPLSITDDSVWGEQRFRTHTLAGVKRAAVFVHRRQFSSPALIPIAAAAPKSAAEAKLELLKLPSFREFLTRLKLYPSEQASVQKKLLNAGKGDGYLGQLARILDDVKATPYLPSKHQWHAEFLELIQRAILTKVAGQDTPGLTSDSKEAVLSFCQKITNTIQAQISDHDGCVEKSIYDQLALIATPPLERTDPNFATYIGSGICHLIMNNLQDQFLPKIAALASTDKEAMIKYQLISGFISDYFKDSTSTAEFLFKQNNPARACQVAVVANDVRVIRRIMPAIFDKLLTIENGSFGNKHYAYPEELLVAAALSPDDEKITTLTESGLSPVGTVTPIVFLTRCARDVNFARQELAAELLALRGKKPILTFSDLPAAIRERFASELRLSPRLAPTPPASPQLSGRSIEAAPASPTVLATRPRFHSRQSSMLVDGAVVSPGATATTPASLKVHHRGASNFTLFTLANTDIGAEPTELPKTAAAETSTVILHGSHPATLSGEAPKMAAGVRIHGRARGKTSPPTPPVTPKDNVAPAPSIPAIVPTV